MHAKCILICALQLFAAVSLLHAQPRLSDDGFGMGGNAFIENRGQWNSQARYLLRAPGMNAWITDDGVVYDIYRSERSPAMLPSAEREYRSRPLEEARSGTRTGDVVRLRFEGALPGRSEMGVIPRPGVHNYYLGDDPARWVEGARGFGAVALREIYEGIDAIFYLDRGHLRYDMRVAPGADPARIRMRLEGAGSLAVTDAGALAIGTSGGAVEQRDLFAYQMIGGSPVKVACSFVLHDDGSAGFSLGSYDASVPLVIDPIVYATYLGGADVDYMYDMAADHNGNVFVGGHTEGGDFPTTTGSYQLGANDWIAVAARFDATGRLVYSTAVGGSNDANVSSLAVAPAGASIPDATGSDVYISGLTRASNFPATEKAFDRTHNGYIDAYAARLDSAGRLVFSTFLGGESYENGHAIAVDRDGNSYITGYTESYRYPTTANAYDRSYSDTVGSLDMFVTKLSADGSTLLYSTYVGGNDDERGYDIAVDDEGNAYVSGSAKSRNFPVTPGAYQTTHSDTGNKYGDYDAVVLKLNPLGERLVYSTLIGTPDWDAADAIAIDGAGNAYVTGTTESSLYPVTANAYDPVWGRDQEAVVSKISADGSSLLYSSFLNAGRGYGISLDDAGNVYMMGIALSRELPITPNADFTQRMESFLAVFDRSMERLRYCTYLPGGVVALHSDRRGSVYVAGRAGGQGFAITPGAHDSTFNGKIDFYIMKMFIGEFPASADRPQPGIKPDGSLLGLEAAPNPARSATSLRFVLESPSSVTLSMHSTDGREVMRVADAAMYAAGEHRVEIPLAGLPAGLYWIRGGVPGGAFLGIPVVVR